VPLPFRDRLGPLHGREFRLLFAATTITTLGDSVATVALAFAVLHATGSATRLGIVIAAREVASASMLLLGGVLADRVPRSHVLVGASLLQGTAQAATAAVVLAGDPSLAVLVALQVAYGAGDGGVIPAEVGLVPDTVEPERLHQANALQGISRNAVFVLGPAAAGAVVAAGSPGIALAVDAASFGVCALLLSRIRIPAAVRETRGGVLDDLREGWREFASRTWLWSTVAVFGVGNVFFMFWGVLGPTLALERLGGAGVWGLIGAAAGAGSLAGGIAALRLRPARPLVVCVVTPMPWVLQFLALALDAPAWVVAAAAFAGGIGLALHLALWFTTFQQEIPEHARSRVSSYDALGSFVLNPVGAAVAGPVAVALGADNALLLAAGVILALNLSMLLIPAVWAIRRREYPTTMAAA
jgi:MFS family permease